LTIASGYIINNFYDSQKDLINRPNKSMLDRLVSQKTKLSVYFTINFIVALMALFVSWRAFFFFSVYIFLIWFYSHKIKKQPIIGNLMSAFLAVLPFFAILLYYYNQIPFEEIENYSNQLAVIFAHASFLFLLLLIREMIKDLENLKGDLANNYKTIPIVYGERVSKNIISGLTIGTVIPVYVLIEIYDVGYMDTYFYGCLIVLLFFVLALQKATQKEQFLRLHNVARKTIVALYFVTPLFQLFDSKIVSQGYKYYLCQLKDKSVRMQK
jgi:4-hydroxybenzoate polyprenyltransferase